MAYSLGIYLLNLFLAFISPKFDPSLEQDEGMEDGTAGGLPTKEEEEFRPFVRRLPEFKFWYSTTKAIAIGFLCSWFEIFNLPVFWPVLVVYWLILFGLTSKCPRGGPPASLEESGTGRWLTRCSAAADPAHDQVPLRSLHRRQDALPGRRQVVLLLLRSHTPVYSRGGPCGVFASTPFWHKRVVNHRLVPSSQRHTGALGRGAGAHRSNLVRRTRTMHDVNCTRIHSGRTLTYF